MHDNPYRAEASEGSGHLASFKWRLLAIAVIALAVIAILFVTAFVTVARQGRAQAPAANWDKS